MAGRDGAPKKANVNEIPDRIVERIRPKYRPDSIILSGSHAFGKPDSDSDIDLLIIKRTRKPFHERYADVGGIIRKIRRDGRSRRSSSAPRSSRSARKRETGSWPKSFPGGDGSMAAESLQPDDRFARGKADLPAADILLNNQGDPQVAAALVQQGVEKYLKGWLLSRGWRPAKVHDLQRLLDDAVVYDKRLARHYRLCEKLTAFYFVDRYPFIVKPPDPGAVKDMLAEALKFVAELKP